MRAHGSASSEPERSPFPCADFQNKTTHSTSGNLFVEVNRVFSFRAAVQRCVRMSVTIEAHRAYRLRLHTLF